MNRYQAHVCGGCGHVDFRLSASKCPKCGTSYIVLDRKLRYMRNQKRLSDY